jgi:beta-glucanase (GH16 family)
LFFGGAAKHINYDMKHIALQMMVVSGLFCLVSCTVHKNARRTVLQWEENFNQGTHFDTTWWSKIPRGTADWNRHMSSYDSCYAMRDGKLILRGILNSKFPSDTAKYLTGGLYTKNKISFGYGRLEVSARLHGAQGAWPAIWMLAQNYQWPDGGEIDIMERLNFDSIAYQTIHTHYTYTLGIKDNPKPGATGVIDPNAFNTYAVEKHPDSLVFFINNIKTFTYPRIQTDKAEQFPFNKDKHYLLIDMQLGGSWVGKVNPKDLPVEMEVDWVRFYEFGKMRQ